MSRIDDALKTRERATGTVVSEVEATRADSSSPFTEYHSEEPDRRAHEAAVLAGAVEGTAPGRAVSAAQSIATPAARRHDDEDLQARLVAGTMNTVSVEQYRRVAAALHDWQIETQSRTVMITSALPHEGKTLTVVNLAL